LITTKIAEKTDKMKNKRNSANNDEKQINIQNSAQNKNNKVNIDKKIFKVLT
jgi:hypothetical protein